MSDTAVARTPSVTPDLGSSRANFSIVIPSRLSSAAPAPPLPSTSAAIAVPVQRRAAPATGAAREFIDLTGPSPPTRTRDFPNDSSDESSGQRRSKRARVAPAQQPETVVLSDSDDDDDIIVVNPVAGPSGSSGSSADSSNSAASSTGATVASSIGHPRGFARRGRAHVVLPAGGRRGAFAGPPPASGPVLPASGSRLGIGGSLMSAIGRLTGAAQPAPANAAVRRTRAADPAPNSRASSISSTSSSASANAQRDDDFISQQVAALAAARRDDYEGMEAYYGHLFGLGGYGGGGGYDHLPTGLQGVIPGWKKNASPGKKFGVRMSHPRKVEEGFSRNIINPPEEGETPPPAPTTKGKGKRAASAPAPVETEPACASCLEPLRLAQAGEGRIWVLCCGHAVCGKCLGEAKMRCLEIKAAERKNRWAMDVDGKGKEIVLDDDDEDEAPMPSKGKGKAKAKAKGKGKAKETDVDEAWTTCPVVECDGALSDLLAGDSDPARPFEAYV